MIGVYDYTVILTYLSVISGVSGIMVCLNGVGHPFYGTFFLLLSGLCDTFDGRVARTKKNRTSAQIAFGIQIDSLCDLVGFGVLPGVIVYTVSENKLTSAVTAVFITLAAVIRLAYFNVLEENRQKEETGHRKSYLGVPVTTIALLLPIVYVLNVNGILTSTYCYQIAAAVVGIGFLTPVYIKKPQLIGKIAIVVLGLMEAVAMVFFGNPS